MKELREHVTLPLNVDVGEQAAAELVARLASHLVPGLERSVGEVHWREGDTTGVDWTAEGFVEDAFVVVCLRPSSREVLLLVDPRFAAQARYMTKWTLLFLGSALGGCIAIGVMKRSFGWAILALVATFAAWICADAARHELRIRRAMATLDRDAWRRRFQHAVAIESKGG